MAKREFLQLAHKYEPKKHRISQWFFSEKLDGIRVFYDGGLTRGLSCNQVPWANTSKHGRYTSPPLATGLWTRYGQPVQAPDWFLDQLPEFTLDGELYAGRGNFQTTTSVVRSLVPDSRWRDIRYCIFDSPALGAVLADGEIKNPPNFVKRLQGCVDWVKSRGGDVGDSFRSFRRTYHFLKNKIQESNVLTVLEQRQFAVTTDEANRQLMEWLDEICALGGEGAMVRQPDYCYAPERVHHLLKVKPWHDDEATVIGYTWGRETDRGSRLLGKMGALICNYKGKRFELSGFTDEERRLVCPIGSDHIMRDIAIREQGKEVSDPTITNPMFLPGSQVTFKYRELTNDGLPKEARYWRKHEIV